MTTSTGSGTLTTLLVSTVTNVAATQFTPVSLFSSDPITVTGSGHTVAFFCRANTTDDLGTQINVYVDSVQIITGPGNTPLNAPIVLSSGSHTVQFQAVAFDSGTTINVASMFIIDLGL